MAVSDGLPADRPSQKAAATDDEELSHTPNTAPGNLVVVVADRTTAALWLFAAIAGGRTL